MINTLKILSVSTLLLLSFPPPRSCEAGNFFCQGNGHRVMPGWRGSCAPPMSTPCAVVCIPACVTAMDACPTSPQARAEHPLPVEPPPNNETSPRDQTDASSLPFAPRNESEAQLPDELPDLMDDLPPKFQELLNDEANVSRKHTTARAWTHKDGRMCVARLVELRGALVVLARDGVLYRIPASVLSEADQVYLDSLGVLNSVVSR